MESLTGTVVATPCIAILGPNSWNGTGGDCASAAKGESYALTKGFSKRPVGNLAQRDRQAGER